jgi:hypothetical protein
VGHFWSDPKLLVCPINLCTKSNGTDQIRSSLHCSSLVMNVDVYLT